jgi:NAD(P)-dependent dehydrogenase (short-subunit alcohol dehydrogenase family)
MDGIKDQRVFISGGCGDIGKAVAARFVAEGARVFLGDLNPFDAGGKIAGELHLDRSFYTYCDVSSTSSVAEAFRLVEETLGGLDVAICCAGSVANESFLKISEENWNRTLNVNLTGSLRVSQTAARLMLKNGPQNNNRRGAIILTGSWVQKFPWPEGGSYCVSKAGQEMLMKIMAQELAADGITCNMVAPGIVYAGLSKTIYDSDHAYRHRADHTVPMGRLSSVEEVAGAFLYLASADAGYITGTSIVVDGGASLGRRDA